MCVCHRIRFAIIYAVLPVCGYRRRSCSVKETLILWLGRVVNTDVYYCRWRPHYITRPLLWSRNYAVPLYLAGWCECLPSVSPRAKFSPCYLSAPLPEPGAVHILLPVVVDLPGRTVGRVRYPGFEFGLVIHHQDCLTVPVWTADVICTFLFVKLLDLKIIGTKCLCYIWQLYDTKRVSLVNWHFGEE